MMTKTILFVGFLALAFAATAPKSTKCGLCEFVLSVIDVLGTQDEAQILAKLDTLCADLGPLASICKSFAAAELPKILAELANGTAREKVCAKLNLCP